MVVLTIVFGIFGVLGTIAAIWGMHYGRQQKELARKQTEIMVRDIEDRKKREAEDNKWAQRFEDLSRKLRRINPRLQVQEPGRKTATWIYTTMFLDPKFRIEIENYIVQKDHTDAVFLPRKPQPHEFRSQSMRNTIIRAEDEMERFVQEHPFCKQHLYG